MDCKQLRRFRSVNKVGNPSTVLKMILKRGSNRLSKTSLSVLKDYLKCQRIVNNKRALNEASNKQLFVTMTPTHTNFNRPNIRPGPAQH